MKDEKSEKYKRENKREKFYCVKSVQIRSFFWSVFSRIFGLNKLHIWTLFRQCFVVKFKPFWKNSKIEGFILLAWVPSEITKIGNLLMKRQSCHHIETSQLICSINQLTGFFMMATLTFNKLNFFQCLLSDSICFSVVHLLGRNSVLGDKIRIWILPFE